MNVTNDMKLRIVQLERELADLKAKEKADQLKKHQDLVATLTHGMEYEELCELRVVVNDYVKSKYTGGIV